MASRAWRKPSSLRGFLKSKLKRRRTYVQTSQQRKQLRMFSVEIAENEPFLSSQRNSDDESDMHLDAFTDDNIENSDECRYYEYRIIFVFDLATSFIAWHFLYRPKGEENIQSYAQYREKQNNAWRSINDKINSAFMSSNMLRTQSDKCIICQERESCFRCHSCGPCAQFCESCCIKQHSSCRQLHIPEYWTRGYFTPCPFRNIEIPLSHVCNTVFKLKITVVDLNGKFYALFHYQCTYTL